MAYQYIIFQKEALLFSIKFPNNDFPCIHLYMGWDPQGGNFLEQDFVLSMM
jgi:hypothetical protein